MELLLIILVLAGLAFTVFTIYFIFKILQFVILAVNLYKKMVTRQDAMIELLLDIRDNKKQYENSSREIEDASDDNFICENCKSEVPLNAKLCPSCGAEFE